MGNTLTKVDWLGMREVVGAFTGRKLGATFFRDTSPIDGAWATPDILVTGTCVMLAGHGVGDHWLLIVIF